MGKKRKAGGGQRRSQGTENGDEQQVKLNIRSFEDIADSEDEFHINRDKIFLEEEPARKRQRMFEEQDTFLEPSDEEVLATPEEEADLDEYDTENELENGKLGQRHGERDKKRATEVSGSESEKIEEDFDAQGWGSSRQDYYDADVIETEADALEEEQEAIRLQKKQLQSMTEADFGFDEAEWLDAKKADENEGERDVVREVLPQLEVSESMSMDERMKILRTRYPEFVPLAQEFLALDSTEEQLRLDSTAAQTLLSHRRNGKEVHDLATPVATLKWSALSAYLGALSMYFAIFTSGIQSQNGRAASMSPENLRKHPIMDTLMKCRSVWEKLKDVSLPDLETSANGGFVEDTKVNIPTVRKAHKAASPKDPSSKTPRKPRKSKAQKAAEKALVEAEAHRAERMQKTEEDLAKLSTLKPKSLTRATAPAPENEDIDEDDSDFGEETALTLLEAEEKAKRKKSLRFYTSQIVQKANKRVNAGRDAGGDADIPYRERFRDRQARLNAGAEARGSEKQGKYGVPLGGGESDEEDDRVAQEIRANDDEDYYDFVSARTQKKKADKEALAALGREVTSQGQAISEVEEVRPGGKRAITYTIEKNKGLTPRRKKEVRNPRVKKRKKFDEKKKKLGSIRQVYKGGEGRGYGGELTGIKTNLVRGVKL